ncbi:MAG: hypothetical protein ACK5NT_03780 [Pyrinomonadaceae bacterium]
MSFEITNFVLLLIGAVAAYLIGFGFGRRSAYKDVEENLGVPIAKKFTERRLVAKSLVIQMFK